VIERVRWFTVLILVITGTVAVLFAVDEITFEQAVVYMLGALVLATIGERE